MSVIQGAERTSYPSAPPGREVPDRGAFVAVGRARDTAVREARSARTASARTRGDIRAAGSGVVAAPWIAPAAAGVFLSLVFAWTVVQVVVSGPFVALDQVTREWVYAHRAQGWVETFLEAQAFVTGERWATVPVVMGTAAYVAYRQSRMRPLYAVMAGLSTIAAIGYPVKFGLGRSSPVTGLDLLSSAGGQAFPSGHAANTAFTATMVVFLLYGSAGLRPDGRRFRRGLLCTGGLLGVTGVLVLMMGYHWLSDIPAGWLMGLVAVCVSLTALHWPHREHGADDAG